MKHLLAILLLIFNSSNLFSQVLTNHLFQKWILVATYDPFDSYSSQNPDTNAAIASIDTSKYKSTYQFTRNNELLIDDNWNDTRSEKWKWNVDSTKFEIYNLNYSSQTPPDRPVYSMYVYKLTPDSLILGSQGRHGIVREYYLPVRD